MRYLNLSLRCVKPTDRLGRRLSTVPPGVSQRPARASNERGDLKIKRHISDGVATHCRPTRSFNMGLLFKAEGKRLYKFKLQYL